MINVDAVAMICNGSVTHVEHGIVKTKMKTLGKEKP